MKKFLTKGFRGAKLYVLPSPYYNTNRIAVSMMNWVDCSTRPRASEEM